LAATTLGARLALLLLLLLLMLRLVGVLAAVTGDARLARHSWMLLLLLLLLTAAVMTGWRLLLHWCLYWTCVTTTLNKE
jgi:hypothetical protein